MRTSRLVRPAVIVIAGAALTLSLATVPSYAARTYQSTATVTRSATTAVTARVSADARASATVGTPPVTATATGRASAAVTARATRSATATVVGRAGSPRAARRAAARRAAAHAAAVAHRKAWTVARTRARKAAHLAATRRARAAAKANATAAARGRAPVAAASAPCGGVDPHPGDGRTWTCTFGDEFDGDTLDTSKWSVVTTADSGYRNNAAECFVDSPANVSVSGGTLKLTTRSTPGYRCSIPHVGTQTTPVTSGSVSSIGKFSQQYGTFSVRAKFPAATVAGLHSALWMWPDNASKYGAWPTSGELDIAEFYTRYPDRAIPYLHYLYDPASVVADVTGSLTSGYSFSGTNIATNNYCMIDPKQFHTYTVTWTAGTITIDFDGHTCLRNDFHASGLPGGAPFDQPFFMVLTQALGSAGTANAPTTTTPLPATTEVDYVRAWQAA